MEKSENIVPMNCDKYYKFTITLNIIHNNIIIVPHTFTGIKMEEVCWMQWNMPLAILLHNNPLHCT